MAEPLVVFITVPSKEEGECIGKTLVEENLAACVNIIPHVESIFHWEGEMCQEGEMILIVKSTRENLESLTQRVKELHSYQVPEIIALPIVGGSEDYLKWLEQETQRR